MISGACMRECSIERTVLKSSKFLLIFLGASLAYGIDGILFSNIFCAESIPSNWYWNSLINYKFHLWFLVDYIKVLLFAPIVICFLDNEKDTKLGKYFFLLWMIWGQGVFLLSTILDGVNMPCGTELLDLLGVFLAKNYIGYFVLGRLLISGKIKISRTISSILGIISTLFLYVISCAYSFKVGHGDQRWMSGENIFVMFQALALFNLFSNFKFVTDNFRNVRFVVTKVCPHVFCIYLVHVFFIDWMTRLNVFNQNGIIGITLNPFLNIVFRILIIFCLSLITSILYRKTIKGIDYASRTK